MFSFFCSHSSVRGGPHTQDDPQELAHTSYELELSEAYLRERSRLVPEEPTKHAPSNSEKLTGKKVKKEESGLLVPTLQLRRLPSFLSYPTFLLPSPRRASCSCSCSCSCRCFFEVRAVAQRGRYGFGSYEEIASRRR